MKRGLLMLAVSAAALTALPAPAGARVADGCRPLRALFYAASGSLGLAQALAANASPCAQYYVSVPPLTADKTQMRSGTAGPIRALGPGLHALAEVNVTAWQGWVTSTGSSWYQAGVEARRRMAAAGFAVAAGDTWAVNELSSAVRVGTGTSRQDIRDLVHGLYDGDGGPPAKGVVFVTGIGQPTGSLDTYKARLESWLQDAGFWGDMSAYVSDYLQENYGDVREYAVAGADVPTRLGYLNAYLEHVLDLARSGPATAASAAGYLATSYAALANAAWAWTSGFGFTAVSSDVMQDYVSAQLAAMRAYDTSLGWSADRIGFAWDPSNSLGLTTADFNAQLAAVQARLAAAIAADDACAAPWCTASVDGAAFTPAWGAFSTWTPTTPAFASAPQTVTAGTASGPMSVQLQIGPIASPLPFDTTVTLSSSSSGGSFSTSSTGPWTPTLALTVPAGAGSATFYMLDSQPGTPTVTASLDGAATTQVEAVNPPAAALALGSDGNTVTYVLGGAPVAADAALTVSDAASPTLVSASVSVTSGLDPGDVLSASATQGINAAYANGTLTFSGTAPVAAYQAALRSVVFNGTTATSGMRSLLWTVADGSTTAWAVSTIVYTTPPGAPAGISAQPGNGQATVTFGAPPSDGGTPITVYTVTAEPGGATATGTNSPIAVGGLTNGTAYTFTVTASNAAGTGPASTPSNAVVPAGSGGGGSVGGGGAALPPPTVTTAATAPLTPPLTAPLPPATTPPPAQQVGAVTVSFSGLHAVRLGAEHPAITFTVRASRAARLVVTLRDVKGTTLATWRRTLKQGGQKLSLPLAPRVQHAGTRWLRLVWRHGGRATLSVTLKR
jgi:hypothetical protein